MFDVMKRIRQERRAKEISQGHVAKLCNVSVDTYRRWEAGKKEPTLTQLIILSRALNVDLQELLTSLMEVPHE